MIIKHPMDFGTMKDKIVANEYKSVTEFKVTHCPQTLTLVCSGLKAHRRAMIQCAQLGSTLGRPVAERNTWCLQVSRAALDAPLEDIFQLLAPSGCHWGFIGSSAFFVVSPFYLGAKPRGQYSGCPCGGREEPGSGVHGIYCSP